MKNSTGYFRADSSDENRIRLFCFPYAGGGASVFRTWQNILGNKVEVLPAHYKGHEDRITDKPVSSMKQLVDELYAELRNLADRPFYLFGHSVGSRVSYELSVRFEKDGNKFFKGLMVSAGLAPDQPEVNPIYDLPDKEFYKGLNKYNKTPEEIYKDKTLWNIFEPVLRADFKLADTYCNRKETSISVPILGLRGTADPEISSEDILEWGRYTRKGFRSENIEGEHLFIDTNPRQVLREIKKFIYRTGEAI
ncbi:MAG: thioesterase [Eubacterium sp.]|nr:thioesterase [Eubacterium sp.]